MWTEECFPKWAESESCSVMWDSLRPHGLCSPWNSLGQNTKVGTLFLLQQIFLTQEFNQGSLHCRYIRYQLSYQGSPKFTGKLSKSLTSCWTLTLMCKGQWWILLLSTMLCVCVCVCVCMCVSVCVWLTCVLLCNPMTCSFPGSSVHGISQIRIQEWAAIPFPRGFSQHMDWTWVSHSTDRFFIIWATSEAHNTLDHSFTCLLLIPGC